MEPVKKDRKMNWKRWLNYQSIINQMPFFLFLAALAVVYIYNGHHADKLTREISKTTRELTNAPVILIDSSQLNN